MAFTNAIVIPEPERIELREVALTEPGPDDVVVQTAYTSISAGTERMLLAGRMPHPMLQFPVVPGYETVGRVVGIGRDASPELAGQWVYVGGARCFTGVNPAWGGQAAVLHADSRRVVPLGDVPPEQGVLLALGATALHGVDLLATEATEQKTNDSSNAVTSMAHLLAGRRVLVLGQGPVGQIAARLLQTRGAWVAVSDNVANRLARARADVIINTESESLSDMLGGQVDTIIDATGSMAAITAALPVLANNGTILLLGYYDKLDLPYMPLFLKQVRLLTAKEWGPNDLQRVRDLLANGALHVENLITHRMPIGNVQEAYRIALGNLDCLKLVLDWGIQNPESGIQNGSAVVHSEF